MRKPTFFALTMLALAVLAPVNAMTQTVTFNKSIVFDGVTVTVQGSLTIDTTAKTVVGTVSVTVVNNTSGEIIFSKTFNINTTIPIKFALAAPAANLMLAVNCSVDVATHSTACFVSKDPDVNQNGVVDIDDILATVVAWGTAPSSANWNSNLDFNNNRIIDIDDILFVATNWGLPVIQ